MTEQPAGAAPVPDNAQERPQCAACVMVKVLVFAAFTAYIAADFASGGRLTGWVLAAVRGLLPGRAGDEP